MQEDTLLKIIKTCRQRHDEGSASTAEPFGQQALEWAIVIMADRHQELRVASMKAMGVAQLFGWEEATTSDNLSPEDMVEAVAAQEAYAGLKKAMGATATFASWMHHDGLVDKKTKAAADIPAHK